MERNMDGRLANPRIAASDAAAFLGVKLQTLARWRSAGHPSIPFYRINGRIQYALSDLDAFVSTRKVNVERMASRTRRSKPSRRRTRCHLRSRGTFRVVE